MKIANGYNSHTYQQQRTNTRHTGFTDMYAFMSKNSENAETSANTVSTEIDVQNAYEEATAQTAGIRSNVKSSRSISDFAKAGWESFCKMNGIDTTRPLNENSSGDKDLTPEQIAMLKEKYDVKNLTPQERYDLLRDLTDMGVLSADDARLTTVGIIFTVSLLIPHSDSDGTHWHLNIPKSDFASYMIAWVQREQSDYDYMVGLGSKFDDLDEQQQRNYQSFQTNKQNIDHLMASHKKVANILSQLVRE